MSNGPPAGWPRITSAVFYEDPTAAVPWLCAAFGFAVRVRIDDDAGKVVHAELTLGDGVLMVAATSPTPHRASPGRLRGANTQSLMIFVDDVDAHCATARAAGALIVTEPQDQDQGDHIDRGYLATCPEGHHWWFTERRSNPNS